MKILKLSVAITCLAAFFLVSCSTKRPGEPRVLVFTKTAGFHHASIPDGVQAVMKLGAANGFLVDTTSNADKFTEDTLKQYAAIIFMSTTGEVLDYRQQADFERYIQAGGGWVGVHAATDCGYTWPWYGKLSGGYFNGHPSPQQATVDVIDKNFPGTKDLPSKWTRTDEWYNFRDFNKDVHVLATLDEKSYKGGTMGAFHPIVWYHDYDGGRAFYMELGHTSESYTEPDFLKLLLGGIQYAIGKNLELNYGKATALRVPDEDRFSVKVLSRALYEPEQMAILPDTTILVVERRGQILYLPGSNDSLQQVAQINVYDHSNVKTANSEEGLLGVAADPDYKNNHWVYIYYSPMDKVVDRLSRFKFQDGRWDMKSEQVILEIPTERNICCHTGGSLAFNSQGDLFLSVGDNTTPFDETDSVTGKAYPINSHGYSPIDDRPGFLHYDDRRAAGNSNDLRGKILRIRVKADGSYEIPTDNLFPPGEAKTKPEIFVMGDRNPYRISVDQHNGFLYWGEVGPDANDDSLDTHGPRGYDEINQARKAGNFGWPYFVGPNLAYHEYNYATGQPGPAFDSLKPVNNSRNNTGLKVLPPAQRAFIWYPYAASKEFPVLGSGGRCAMAGPVYYADGYPEATRLPEYYNGKLFIYDFVRNWIMAVTTNKEGDLQTIEPFIPHTRLHSPIDMKLGPDGRLYILDYGSGWFQQNPDAGLLRIDYNPGNRPPVVSFKISKRAGALPFTLHLSANGSYDPDGGKLTYLWNLGNGVKKQTDTNETDYTFGTAGDYPVSVEVQDDKGAKTTSPVLDIYAGNEIPQVKIGLTGNSTFYFPDKPVAYKVEVNDKEDGSSDEPGFNQAGVFVKADYLNSLDKAALSPGNADAVAAISGRSLMESLDCQSCHKINEKSVGPAFTQVAAKYKNDPKAMNYLPYKIIKGGSGVWGQVAMAAHPNLAVNDAKKIVTWVLSLADTTAVKSLPVSGSIRPSQYKLTDNGVLYIQASYTDKGGSGIKPLTGSADAMLHSPLVRANEADTLSGFSPGDHKGLRFEASTGADGIIGFKNISLQEITAVELAYGVSDTLLSGWKVEMHLDAPGGKLLGTATLGVKVPKEQPAKAVLSVTGPGDTKVHDIYFVFHKTDQADKGGIGVAAFRFMAR